MRYVLFVCNHNAGRSQMAEGFFERLAPPDVRVESAGTEPADSVWPAVIEAMAEVGVDLSRKRPKRLTVEMQLHADWAITMGCGDSCPYVPTTVEDWDLPDPRFQSLDGVRVVRDEIERRVAELVAERLDAIRNDPLGHTVRLRRLLPPLVEEFGARLPDEEIRACADAVLASYDGARVRSFVMTLAYRKARECLAAGACAPL
jgi:arsenate reductase (thioredoxin)